jgi:taurine dioxygenase
VSIFRVPCRPEHVSAIRAALLRWKVVFFRNQSLDHRRHIALARQFGDTTAGHVVYGSDGEFPQIYSVAKDRKANRFQGQVLFRPWSGWHTDITAAINPPAASILRGEVVPPYGGDTQFTNLGRRLRRAVTGHAARLSTACAAYTGSRRRPAWIRRRSTRRSCASARW